MVDKLKPAAEVAEDMTDFCFDDGPEGEDWNALTQGQVREYLMVPAITADRLAVAERVIEACAKKCEKASASLRVKGREAELNHYKDEAADCYSRASALSILADNIRALDPAKILEVEE